MNPSTGVFTSEDEYDGNILDPISINKYFIVY